MYDMWSVDHADAFQLGWLYLKVIEQSDAVSKQERRHVDMDLIHEL